MKIMISGIVPGRSLGTAAAVAALLSVAAFSSATPARAQAPEDTNVLNSMLGFVGMQFDKDQDFDPRPGATADRRSASHRFAAAEAAVRDPSWPKDPDAAARHAARRWIRGGPAPQK